MKNQKGITLIALVITIIVLLILAGVSIAMLTGDNGLLSKGRTAGNETAKAEAVERINMALNAVKAEVYSQKISNSNYTGVTSGALDDALKTVVEKEGFFVGQDQNTPNAAQKEYWYYFDNYNAKLYLCAKSDKYNSGAKIVGTITLDGSTMTITSAQ